MFITLYILISLIALPFAVIIMAKTFATPYLDKEDKHLIAVLSPILSFFWPFFIFYGFLWIIGKSAINLVERFYNLEKSR